MRIVILSGAGLSAESGIATFRDKGGLWEGYSVEDVASLDGFTENPAFVYDFYNKRRKELLAASPNAAHFALAKLEKAPGIDLFHVTQNIDDLCERAGAEKIVHMHGELLKSRCLRCSEVFKTDKDTGVEFVCSQCGFYSEWGAIRPHIVWFGEMPMCMKEIKNALKSCDLFVAIGTSGVVYPAAGFVEQVKESGVKTLLLNKEPLEKNDFFDESIIGNATEIVPQWVDSIIT